MLLIFLLQHLRISESFQVMLQLIRVLQLDQMTNVYMDMYICSSNNPKPAFWFYLRPALVNYHVQKVAEKNRNIGILKVPLQSVLLLLVLLLVSASLRAFMEAEWSTN